MKITKRKLKKIIRESLILEINPEFARLTATDASAGKSIAAVRKMDPDEFMKGVEKMGEITGMVVYEIFANFPGLSNYISSAETAKEIWEISRIKKEKEQKERIENFVEAKLLDKFAAQIPAGRLISKIVPAKIKSKASQYIPDKTKDQVRLGVSYLIKKIQGKTEAEAKKIIKSELEGLK